MDVIRGSGVFRLIVVIDNGAQGVNVHGSQIFGPQSGLHQRHDAMVKAFRCMRVHACVLACM